MKELSLEQRIINFMQEVKARYPERFLNGGEIERLAMSVGFKASNASRRCRELVEDGILEARYNEKHHVEYRSKW